MRSKKLSIGLVVILAIFTVTMLVTSTVTAAERTLHNFRTGTDGYLPFASLIFDGMGNLYGTTYYGGDYHRCGNGDGCGTVFELTPDGSGGWTEKKLHDFGDGTDGMLPVGGLIFDQKGNLYGTTEFGGSHSAGTVFELSPNGSGGWTERVLHNFNFNGSDGGAPTSGLIFDAVGNLYGTTTAGGTAGGWGTVFEMSPNGSGGWTEKKLHNFGNGTDGQYPYAGVIFDQDGNLYGTTLYGGNYPCDGYGCGTVFELTPNGSGGWTEKKIHNFRATDGERPFAGVILDQNGNLYGTAEFGGSHSAGTAFELTPNGSGGWTEKKLHNFGNGSDGQWPVAGLIFDQNGNLYGTTLRGGRYSSCQYLTDGCGTVFELTPNGSGGWMENRIHSFGKGTDGQYPQGGLIFDVAGNLYGTTEYGGDYQNGTVFEIIP
jgi:uncharacterized repeat protein (TIGR03803 family)